MTEPALREASTLVLTEAAAQQLAGRLIAKDAGLWGDSARAEAAIRLGWLDLPRTSRDLLPQIQQVREGLAADGLDHIVLAGMGGSSLAPEVITANAGVELTVLDTTDPLQLRRALADRIERTVVIIASKSGSTIETDSHRRAYIYAFREAGLSDADIASRFIVITDPDSPLEQVAREGGYRALFLADPMVGGRYSALSAFGLVPSGLAGADVATLLDDAEALLPALAELGNNPGLLLGAALGAAARTGQNKLVLTGAGPTLTGFGDWAEQLIAESTGKAGTGILPIVLESPTEARLHAGSRDTVTASLGGPVASQLEVKGPLGAQFLIWEYATAVVGWALGISPFDQPNVTESKDNTGRLLEAASKGGLDVSAPLLTDGAIQVFGDEALLGNAKSIGDALRVLLDSVDVGGYLAVMAYLDRVGDADATQLRQELARHLRRNAVTFGWGPRFLQSTGQLHKGGPQVGVFLQITGAVENDLQVPDRPYTFGTLQMAQALGDLGALRQRGRPVLRLHLTDRAAGIAAVLDALRA